MRFTSSDGSELAGHIRLPAGEPAHPVGVFIHGAGGSANTFMYPPLWRVFLDAGFAVFSWDSPGLGESKGDMWAQTFQDRADEVHSGIEALKRLDTVDPDRIGLWAISQGGWIAPLVVSQRSDVAFMILVAAPAVPLLTQDLFQMEHRMRADDRDEGEIREALAFRRETHRLLLQGVSHRRYLRAADRVTSRPWYAEYASLLANARAYEFFKRNAPHDPVPPLQGIRCPVLLIYGRLDAIVDGPRSEGIFRREFERARNENLSAIYVDHADHQIFESQTGGGRELQ